MPIVGAVGVAGNLLSVAVLSGKEMSNSFNKLLITLTIFDTTFIVFMVIDYTGFRGNSAFTLNFPIISYYICSMAMAFWARVHSLRVRLPQVPLPPQQHLSLMLHLYHRRHRL